MHETAYSFPYESKTLFQPMHTTENKLWQNTYRIPTGARPGLLPNGKSLGINLADGLPFRYREEGVHDRTWVGLIKGKDVGLVGQKWLGELLHCFDDGGIDLIYRGKSSRRAARGIGGGGEPSRVSKSAVAAADAAKLI